MPKNTVHGGASNVDDPDLDPRKDHDPADFVSTGEGSSEDYQREPEDAETAQDAPTGSVGAEPPAPGSGPQSSFSVSGSLDVTEPVPTGSIEDIQKWVDGDWQKAGRALEVERAGKNRSSLTTWLEKVVATR